MLALSLRSVVTGRRLTEQLAVSPVVSPAAKTADKTAAPVEVLTWLLFHWSHRGHLLPDRLPLFRADLRAGFRLSD